MIIFLRNIPPETKKYEIASFINRAFNECLLDNRSIGAISIADVEFLSILNVNSNTLEKHGLVRIFPKEVGKRIIKKLEGTVFKQKPITVREYFNRSAQNDPRNTNTATEIDLKERRTSDRRRIPLTHSWQNNPILVQ